MQALRSRPFWFALLGAAFAALVFLLDLNGFFTVADARLQDRLLEPRPASPDIVIVAIDDKSIQDFGVWPWPRSLHAQMIDTLSAAGAKAIGYDVTFSEASDDENDTALETAIRTSGRVVLASEGQELAPLPRFAEASAYGISGDASLQPDADGVVRAIVGPGSFADVTACRCAPVDLIRIAYVGPPGSFATYSFSDVLHGTVPATAFKDKIVFVGATAPDLHDAALTPTSHGEPMAGVEIHANLAQSLLEGRNLHVLGGSFRTMLYGLLAIFIIILATVLSLRYLVFAVPGVLVVYLLIALAAVNADLLLPITAPLLLILGIGGADIVSRYAEEKLRRRFIHQAFAHYLAPQVIQKLIKGETKLELGGVKEELTILFSDIRGFTTLSEKLSPEELVKLLNEYLTAMTDVVLGTEGVVDKYIGDAIMAFWGAPLPQPDHAVRAATAAVKMKRRLDELKTKWKSENRPDINIGVGINAGPVIVGNMGSSQRFDYTVMGDDVNLASRLEGLTKQYGVTILISENVRVKLGEQFIVRELDLVAVKGKKLPVRIFELVDTPDAVGADMREQIRLFEEALRLYRSRKWDEALAILASLPASDKPVEILTERCRAMKQDDPGNDWDGVYHAKEK